MKGVTTLIRGKKYMCGKFIKQLRRYGKAFNHDEQIEAINADRARKMEQFKKEFSEIDKSKLTTEERDRLPHSENAKKTKIERARLTSLDAFAKDIGVAPQIRYHSDDGDDCRLKADELENRLRLYLTERQSIYISGFSFLIAVVSSFITFLTLMVVIFK